MVWVQPRRVTLMGAELTGVRAVVVNVAAKNVMEEWTDGGPYAAFVDASGVSVEIVIERDAVETPAGIAGGLAPGQQGTLRVVASPAGGSAHAEEVEATVVVTSVKHTLHGGNGPAQRIALRAVSVDGATPPLGAPSGGK